MPLGKAREQRLRATQRQSPGSESRMIGMLSDLGGGFSEEELERERELIAECGFDVEPGNGGKPLSFLFEVLESLAADYTKISE